MAPMYDDPMSHVAASPILIMTVMVIVAVAVLASLMLAALICACDGGKKKEVQPSAIEELQKMPEPQPPAVETSSEPATPVHEEEKSAITAVEASSMSMNASMKREQAPDFQLTSATADPYSGMRPPPNPSTASLQLTSVMSKVPQRELPPKSAVKAPVPQPIEQPDRVSLILEAASRPRACRPVRTRSTRRRRRQAESLIWSRRCETNDSEDR